MITLDRYIVFVDPGVDRTVLQAFKVTADDDHSTISLMRDEYCEYRRTPYDEIADAVVALVSRPPFRGKADLYVDTTGVGRAFLDFVAERGLNPKPMRRMFAEDE
jgi:hypothetical protein